MLYGPSLCDELVRTLCLVTRMSCPWLRGPPLVLSRVVATACFLCGPVRFLSLFPGSWLDPCDPCFHPHVGASAHVLWRWVVLPQGRRPRYVSGPTSFEPLVHVIVLYLAPLLSCHTWMPSIRTGYRTMAPPRPLCHTATHLSHHCFLGRLCISRRLLTKQRMYGDTVRTVTALDVTGV